LKVRERVKDIHLASDEERKKILDEQRKQEEDERDYSHP
jgi:hypothetical protein